MSKQGKSSKLVNTVYNAAYRVGFSPWDLGPPMPELVDLIEGEQALAPGRALDLGCGAGTKSVYLAQHGWKVTGADVSTEAIKQARRKAEDSGVTVDFVVCDLLSDLDGILAGPYDFLLDFGCAHSFRDAAKAVYARNIAAVAAPGATLYLYAFTKGPLSVRQSEIDTDFAPYWNLVSAVPGSKRGIPDAGPTWYRLTRKD
ncbi:Methyltransferase domain-containing protein [Micromonospora viridifaciens]|uniref:Methyltransferase domain-containing protein n=2 Tax=Micromonospora viridifaciens TaxID=1881 RepID=A0A1C4ZQ72_MICVI|nr:Methyltransferase domain-containing protein [Micromonospora viridifaciens]